MKLINKSAVRKYAIHKAAERFKKKKFKRVSRIFLAKLDRMVENEVDRHVKSMPTVGRTI